MTGSARENTANSKCPYTLHCEDSHPSPDLSHSLSAVFLLLGCHIDSGVFYLTECPSFLFLPSTVHVISLPPPALCPRFLCTLLGVAACLAAWRTVEEATLSVTFLGDGFSAAVILTQHSNLWHQPPYTILIYLHFSYSLECVWFDWPCTWRVAWGAGWGLCLHIEALCFQLMIYCLFLEDLPGI